MIVKFDSIEDGENQGLRVLEMREGSPAFLAGLVAYKDYIIGSGDIIIRHVDDLSQILQDNDESVLTLNVYNSETESIREVEIIPNRNWGGEGLLGCGIGTGVLHRIPMGRLSPLVPSVPAPIVPSQPALTGTDQNHESPVPEEGIESPLVASMERTMNSDQVVPEQLEVVNPERQPSSESAVMVEKQDISALFP
jgi:hypothetical protein